MQTLKNQELDKYSIMKELGGEGEKEKENNLRGADIFS